ncbi:hypothetical protein WAF17_02025 [Bernardetia sp. ABR2-2B]|uniref:hypothetical protein n=1 Tax=Bernardetia sp. ABR2-2B TaxID=3127472 RepID=UPI0030D610D9
MFFQKENKEWFYRYKNENISLNGKRPKRYIGSKIILHDSVKNIDYLASALPIDKVVPIKKQLRINDLYAIEVKVMKYRSLFREDYDEVGIIKHNNLFYKVTSSDIVEVTQYPYDKNKSLTNRMLILSPYSYVDKAVSQKVPSTAVYSDLGFFIDYEKDSSFIYDEQGNYLDKHEGEVNDIVRYKESTLPIYYKDSIEGYSMYLPNNKQTLKNIQHINNGYGVTYIASEKDTLIITKDTLINNINYFFREKTVFGFIKNDIPDSMYLISYEKGTSFAVPNYLETIVADTLERQGARYNVVTIKEDTFFYHCLTNQEFVIKNYSTGKKRSMRNVETEGFSEGFIFLKQENEMMIMNEKGDIVHSFEVYGNATTTKFQNGLALIKEDFQNKKQYYIDKEGNKYSVFD